MTLRVFKKSWSKDLSAFRTFRTPLELPYRGYGGQGDRAWRASPSKVAIGLAALGPNFAACGGSACASSSPPPELPPTDRLAAPVALTPRRGLRRVRSEEVHIYSAA